MVPYQTAWIPVLNVQVPLDYSLVLAVQCSEVNETLVEDFCFAPVGKICLMIPKQMAVWAYGILEMRWMQKILGTRISFLVRELPVHVQQWEN